MFLNMILFLFFLVICHSMDSKIGNYSQYIGDYKLCGLSRNTLRDDSSNCFQYNHNFSSNLKNARDVDTGEAPWTVTVIVRTATSRVGSCGGVLISDQWVLTAAHCIVEDFYRIFFDLKNVESGSFIDSVKAIKHPKYDQATKGHEKTPFDIALIKLATLLGLNYGIDYSSANFICLPTKNFTFNGRKLAMIAGWGRSGARLQIGPAFVEVIKRSGGRLIQNYQIFGSSRVCQGDSGSPVWMYDMGRAFLIGTHSAGGRDQDGCGGSGYNTFVPDHIDWILETIRDE